ncbi:hypothetical protein PGT21_022980 [Puccinia graminis f. sp. tritici]|uniref:Uncharacterized protein n=1 Tax=Puccinia graminis f. sp. tritici TaxID=56615 RepID=A0A5B0LQG6_PUCGR|nr:hypothetical protein PGTUg99_016666 [Puccinia graminis f. sp. tritici]KAA1071925.1 hypothetical protein PGT21_022980 [Puccinia graminis f. sp. tritici]
MKPSIILASFEQWMKSLNLLDHFLSLGYSPQHANLLGSPPPPPPTPNQPNLLRDIVLHAPQKTNSVDATMLSLLF